MMENCRKLLRIVGNCSSALAAPRPDCVFFFLVTVPVGEKACLIFLLSWNSIRHSNLLSLRKSIIGS